jgi:hypothetical protein
VSDKLERMMKLATLVFLLSFLGVAFAGTETAKPSSDIPTNEKEDIQSASGKLVASIWQYHYLNTDEKGEYYQTTELDFMDDKVVMVVFMNNDGKEIPADAIKATPGKK